LKNIGRPIFFLCLRRTARLQYVHPVTPPSKARIPLAFPDDRIRRTLVRRRVRQWRALVVRGDIIFRPDAGSRIICGQSDFTHADELGRDDSQGSRSRTCLSLRHGLQPPRETCRRVLAAKALRLAEKTCRQGPLVAARVPQNHRTDQPLSRFRNLTVDKRRYDQGAMMPFVGHLRMACPGRKQFAVRPTRTGR